MAADEAVSVVAVAGGSCGCGSLSGWGAAKETFFVLVMLGSGSGFLSGTGGAGGSVGKSCSLLPWSMLDRRRSFCSSAGLRLDMSSWRSCSISASDMAAIVRLFSSSMALRSSSGSGAKALRGLDVGASCVLVGGFDAAVVCWSLAARCCLKADTLGVRFLCAGKPFALGLSEGATGGVICAASRSWMSLTKEGNEGIGSTFCSWGSSFSTAPVSKLRFTRSPLRNSMLAGVIVGVRVGESCLSKVWMGRGRDAGR